MNDLSKVVDKLLAQGLLALRGTCVMPRLVNSDYSNLAAQQGASIDVPIPSAIKAQAVTPGATSQDTTSAPCPPPSSSTAGWKRLST